MLVEDLPSFFCRFLFSMDFLQTKETVDVGLDRQRSDEPAAIFKRLYEDSVLGRITPEQFQILFIRKIVIHEKSVK